MKTQRKGSSLVEFALVSLVLYLLLGAILTFGHALYVAQQVQMSADFLAREISRRPLSVQDESLRDALADGTINSTIFNEELLIFDLNQLSDRTDAEELQETIANWPIVNRMLSVVMINNGTNFQIPGAVPRVINGKTRIQIAKTFAAESDQDDDWVDVVEEVLTSAGDSLYPPDTDAGGVVALRINYPIHSVFFTAMDPPPKDAKFADPNANFMEVANPGEEFTEAAPKKLDPRTELYGGDKGLGRQYAWGTQVRPYRRIVSGQAIYRREVFTQ
ncbi:hypothetical protein DTL42_04805 [Bremerella cremea]|uniref:TadE-like domain-containing protein n=1 Tax=Bremerella cremea TaxID=1031537 RepID=A0A368KXQ8_9BACT|nr:TadE/TadG family type IV pilus assembly protein [Bremerella cremea]RCS54465.1 hypothetical protein DTL42_04805 [Bremerella cremea]